MTTEATAWGALLDEPAIQQPIVPDSDLPKALPPFVMPPVGNDTPRPRVLAIAPRVRGKKNPISAISVGGQDFVTYRLPDRASVAGTDPATIRPVLPVVMLTDKQVEALRERAKLVMTSATFRPPETDEDALTGYHAIPASEFIVIADYKPGHDAFALARDAHAADQKAAKENDTRPPLPGADEVQKAESALRQSNDRPQRGEHVAAAARGNRS